MLLVKILQKSFMSIILAAGLAACGGGDNTSSTVTSNTPLFDTEWFTFSHSMSFAYSLQASNSINYNYSIYKDRISKDSQQVLQYAAASVVGVLPLMEQSQRALLHKSKLS